MTALRKLQVLKELIEQEDRGLTADEQSVIKWAVKVLGVLYRVPKIKSKAVAPTLTSETRS